MFGAIFNAARGIKENTDLKKQLEQLKNQTATVHSIDDIIKQFDNAYDQTIAKNKLLLTSYYEALAKSHSLHELKRIWNEVKTAMNDNIAETEQQLQNMEATKLDIARIVASLSQISNEVDLELKSLLNIVEKDQKAVQKTEKSLQQLESTMITNKSNIEKELTVLQEKIYDYKSALNNQFTRLYANFDSHKSTVESELKTLHSSFDSNKLNVNNKLNTLQAIVADEKNLLQTTMNHLQKAEHSIQTLQKELVNQKNEWSAHIERIDAQLIMQEELNTKRLKIWLTPLYIGLAAVGIHFFFM